ncbi:hypothetical protein V6N13_113689 [Hibiscus sabdariffa]|uniref:Uncharacterized protein n=1 Tax=Hibiscus sabdariffa TaxID=183260 RepID=A0ABR2TZS6_9ROSI
MFVKQCVKSHFAARVNSVQLGHEESTGLGFLDLGFNHPFFYGLNTLKEFLLSYAVKLEVELTVGKECFATFQYFLFPIY